LEKVIMKKDLTLGIALILTGSIGLIAQNRFQPSSEALTAKKAHVLRLESKANLAIDEHGGTAVVCQNHVAGAGGKTTLLHKLTSALNDLDTVVTLQRL
jgi:hypothetical protein